MAVNGSRIVVYTCLTGGYDELLPPRNVEDGIDYVCFTDRRPTKSSAWRLEPLPWKSGGHAAINRYAKMHPHVVLPEYDFSIYVDANIEILGGLRELVDNAMSVADIALYQHPYRDCSFAEAQECAAIGHDWLWRIKAQMESYRRQGYPEAAGLFEATVLIRAHHKASICALMADWWTEYVRGVRRDQISLPFLLWKHGVQVCNLGVSDFRVTHHNFARCEHKRSRPLSVAVRRQIYKIFHAKP